MFCIKTGLVLAALAFSVAIGAQQHDQTTEVGISVKKTHKTVLHRAAIKVTIDGNQLDFPDQGPRLLGGRVVVPMRGIFEKLGASVEWNQEENMVVATRGETRIEMPIGKKTVNVGGKMVELDQPAVVVNGRAMVPLRFISEALGARVEWNEAQVLVSISSG